MKQRFLELCRIEPRLRVLMDDALTIRADDEDYFCANDVWYLELKPRLLTLVGWHAENPQLARAEAYDVAYQTIYDALPYCRRCGCL